jgi:hypothetical protein
VLHIPPPEQLGLKAQDGAVLHDLPPLVGSSVACSAQRSSDPGHSSRDGDPTLAKVRESGCQAAAVHKLAMRFIAKADHQLSQVDTWNPASYQAHSVEAARLAHAAGKLMGAFSDTVLSVQRRRSGGKQVVQVIHQQVAVGAGGKAIVAGTVKQRRKTGGTSGGHE